MEITLNTDKRYKYTDRQVAEARRMHAEGYKREVISTKTGIPLGTLKAILGGRIRTIARKHLIP